MSTDTNNNGAQGSQSTDPSQIESEIEATREDLSDTVDALSRKLDVKSQAQERVAGAKQRATQAGHRAQATWQDPHARSEALKKGTPAIGAVVGLIVLLVIVRRIRA